MATYVLIHGAASDSWYWHLLDAELRRRGHDVVAVDLPCDDDAVGLPEYVRAVVDAAAGRPDIVLLAHSLGAVTAGLVPGELPVREIVLLNPLVPAPGESVGEWFANTRHGDATSELFARLGIDGEDEEAVFCNGLTPELAAGTMAHGRAQSGTPFALPWPAEKWPDVPTRVLVSREDRMFPLAFQHRVVAERLPAVTPIEFPGGHMSMLSHPAELADAVT